MTMTTADSAFTASGMDIPLHQADEDFFTDWTADRRPLRIPWLYRMRELEAFAPSQRAAALREALRGTRRHAAFARQCAVGAAFAAVLGLLLVQCAPHTPMAIPAVGLAFIAAMLFERRRTVKQRLRKHLVRNHIAARSVISKPLPFA
jgi:hypothetical protein